MLSPPMWKVLQVASAAATASTGTSFTCAYSTANLSPNTKLLCVVADSHFSGTQGITSVKEGATNTFAAMGTATLLNKVVVALYEFDTTAAEAGTKPTITVTTTDTSQTSVWIAEVAGLMPGTTTGVVLDGAMGTATGTGGASGTSGAYTSTLKGDMLISVYGDDGGTGTFTAPAGYSNTPNADIPGNNAQANIGVAWKNSTGGSETATWTLSGTPGDWGTLLGSFRLSPASQPGAGRQAVKRAAYF